MLSERIDTELKQAAKAQEKRRLGTLRMLKSAMKYREIETGKPLEDADIVGVVGTLIKQRRDSAAQYTAGGRPELADAENEEIRFSQVSEFQNLLCWIAMKYKVVRLAPGFGFRWDELAQ